MNNPNKVQINHIIRNPATQDLKLETSTEDKDGTNTK